MPKKKEEEKEMKVRCDESKKVSVQITSNDSLQCVNSNLNIPCSMDHFINRCGYFIRPAS